jgi:hypothetical protein
MNPLYIKIEFLEADISIRQFASQEGDSHAALSSMIPAYTKASDCVKPWRGSSEEHRRDMTARVASHLKALL